MSVIYQNNTWQDIESLIEESRGVAIVPVGSVEQHSYHLPVGTDTFAAICISEEAAVRTGVPMIPPIWYGWSPHHMALPGTISVRAEILTEYLYDVMASLGTHGLKKVVVVNGHRTTNIPWIQIAAERAQSKMGMTVRLFDPSYMSKEVVESLSFGPLGHADEAETAHMLYRYGELVHMERAVDAPILDQTYSDEPCYPYDALCYIPNTVEQMKEHARISGGASGMPSAATTEKGKIYHDHLVMRLIDIVERLKQQENK